MSDVSQKSYFAYIALCSDGTYYVGYTDDIAKREKTHNSGNGAKYTRSRLPVHIVYYEECCDKSCAMSREWHLKRLSHAQKETLIKDKK